MISNGRTSIPKFIMVRRLKTPSSYELPCEMLPCLKGFEGEGREGGRGGRGEEGRMVPWEARNLLVPMPGTFIVE